LIGSLKISPTEKKSYFREVLQQENKR